MTAKEKEVMLSFMKEQQHYNSALADFVKFICNVPDEEVPDDNTYA